jgi:uncharacterized protein YndB with AHSA1/START domain
MPNILHRVGIPGPADAVYQAIATPEGLSRWWVTGTTGTSKVGGVIKFRQEGGGFDMRIDELTPNRLVRWTCVGGPPEWVGTGITFKLSSTDTETVVLFTHANWKEEVEFMHHCSTKWATFLLSLKSLLERDEGRPLPYAVKIHVGD